MRFCGPYSTPDAPAPDVATAVSNWVGDIPTAVIAILVFMILSGVVALALRMRGGGPRE